jgi:hypothetical protein
MVTIEKVDTSNKAQVRQFVRLPYQMYANTPQWVPPLLVDQEMYLNRKKHPFYEHSTADFFLALRDGEVAGRIAALENTRYNAFHKNRYAQFYFFESPDDQEVAKALFERVFDWAKTRNLEAVVGPKGFSVLDGYGILVEGFEHRMIMNMMNYNFDYYPRLLETLGFVKEVDFVSCYLPSESFTLPERIHRIAERVIQHGTLRVHDFKKKSDLRAWATRIGKLYNDSFVNNWEYYPLTEREIALVLENILMVADPRLIKIIVNKKEEPVGFLFGFLDLSAAMQRAKGHLLPFGIFDIMTEGKRTDWIAVNGAGVLPEYQGHGGNALLYYEMEKTVKNENFHFKHCDMTQVAETTKQMRADLVNLGGTEYKNHRVYSKHL